MHATLTRPYRILIVDDEPNIVVALEFLMQQAGYLTETAYDGREALDKFSYFEPDLIVLDVMMPHMQGYEVAQRIREAHELSTVKIIFLTAKGTARDKHLGYDAGGDVYLTKPFDNQHLIATVAEMLEFG
ncbi:MAG: hypothetical protein OHK0039_42820 [Bacteroidia bacterium]